MSRIAQGLNAGNDRSVEGASAKSTPRRQSIRASLGARPSLRFTGSPAPFLLCGATAHTRVQCA
jgi:hypothetical protein